MSHSIFYVISVFIAFAGFYIALMIRRREQTQSSLVCPFNADCDAVIHSKFSHFLGIRLASWGMAYYGFIGIAYLFLAIFPGVAPMVAFLLLLVSLFAVLFSIYLTSIQAFVLRSWCSWCLMSAVISVALFVSVSWWTDGGIGYLLGKFSPVMMLGYLFFLVLGAGVALVTAFLFGRFLKDNVISPLEDEVLKVLFHLDAAALGGLLIAGLALFIPFQWGYISLPSFLVYVMALAILVINTILLNIQIAPRLLEAYFDNENNFEYKHFSFTRKAAHALVAVSLASWMVIIFLSFVHIQAPFIALLGLFLVIILGAVVISQAIEYRTSRRHP